MIGITASRVSLQITRPDRGRGQYALAAARADGLWRLRIAVHRSGAQSIRMADALRVAFQRDHQRLMRGLQALRGAVQAGEHERAAEISERLDREVGPHIEFEESVYYPSLMPVLGRRFVERLYGEHAAGQRLLREVIGGGGLSAQRRDRLLRRIDAVMEHALSCGTLLSHLDRLTPQRRGEFYRQLEDCRRRGQRWTQLRNSPHKLEQAG